MKQTKVLLPFSDIKNQLIAGNFSMDHALSLINGTNFKKDFLWNLYEENKLDAKHLLKYSINYHLDIEKFEDIVHEALSQPSSDIKISKFKKLVIYTFSFFVPPKKDNLVRGNENIDTLKALASSCFTTNQYDVLDRLLSVKKSSNSYLFSSFCKNLDSIKDYNINHFYNILVKHGSKISEGPAKNASNTYNNLAALTMVYSWDKISLFINSIENELWQDPIIIDHISALKGRVPAMLKEVEFIPQAMENHKQAVQMLSNLIDSKILNANIASTNQYRARTL